LFCYYKEMKRFFQNKNGQVVLGQWPSPLLWGWLIARVLTRLLPEGNLATWCGHFGTALLLVWALLELTSGVNLFRKLLGLLVLVLIVLNYFQR